MPILTCERCGAKCDTGVMCDPCHATMLEGLLRDPYWLTWHGCAAGDRPGEKRADSYRRELKSLRLKIRGGE